MIWKFHEYTKTLPVVLFIPYMAVLSFIVVLPVASVTTILFGHTAGALSGESLLFALVVGVLVSPLVETFAAQMLPISLMGRYTRLSNAWKICISACLFSVGHTYSIRYMINMFPFGLLLAYSYVICQDKDCHPFLVVAAIHALRNAMSVLISVYLFDVL
jgi:hypothetical protein